MVRVKVCGITNSEDAKAAVKAGADMLGFVLYPQSPRYVRPSKVNDIISELPEHIEKCALFVNESHEDVKSTLKKIYAIDILQFHGDETPEYCDLFKERVIKAIRVENIDSLESAEDFKVNFILLDSFSKDQYGGTGRSFDWGILKSRSIKLPIILSGGLDEDNIEDAIKSVKPYAVDVSSGIEISPGIKSHDKMKAFIQKAKAIQI